MFSHTPSSSSSSILISSFLVCKALTRSALSPPRHHRGAVRLETRVNPLTSDVSSLVCITAALTLNLRRLFFAHDDHPSVLLTPLSPSLSECADGLICLVNPQEGQNVLSGRTLTTPSSRCLLSLCQPDECFFLLFSSFSCFFGMCR